MLHRTAVVLLLPPFSKFRALLFANLGLQLLDGSLTLHGLARGFREGNPVVSRAMEIVGPTEAVFAIKCLAIVALFLLYRRGRHPLVIGGLVSIAVAYVVFAIVPWTLLLVGTPAG